MSLRPYQVDLVRALRREFSSHRSVVLQLGTGGGKTHTAAELIHLAHAKGNHCVFAAHLDSLVSDTAKRLKAAGLRCGVIKAGVKPEPLAHVQVASLGTLHARGQELRCDFMILDECQRGPAPTIKGILQRHSKARLLGLSAWPERADGVGVGDCFESMVSGPTFQELTDAGFLVPMHVIGAKEPQGSELAGDPVKAWLRFCHGRKGILFAIDVNHAKELRARFAAVGVRAGLIVGETPSEERESIRDVLALGGLDLVITCRALLEGWDCPAVDCVVWCGQGGSLGGYLQGNGRGARSHPGKADCLVVDLKGYAWTHGLPADPRRCSLFGKKGREAGDTLLPLRRCTNCFAISRPVHACLRCGAAFEALVRPVKVGSGELVDITAKADPERARVYLGALVEKLRRGKGAHMPAWRLEQRALMTAPDWVRSALPPSLPLGDAPKHIS